MNSVHRARRAEAAGLQSVAMLPTRKDHPTERTLRRFVLGTTSRAENRAIVVHLLRRCGRCSRVIAEAGGTPRGAAEALSGAARP